MQMLTIKLNELTRDLKLLYVEDDKGSREQLSKVFEIFFNVTITASDGKEGWEKYQNEPFDLVITDIHMPRMDGIQLSEKIKALNPSQKIIIISAHDTSDYLIPAIRAGVDGFIVKPVEVEQMMEVLEKTATAIHSTMIAQDYYKHLEEEIRFKTLELEALAVTDELTGLFNRNKFNRSMHEVGEKILLLINIDNFDNINISYGYHNGDIILKKIAHFFHENLPQSSLLFHLGYDEFAILFNGRNITEAQVYAEEIKRKITASPIEHEGIIIRFTASIAISQGESDVVKNAHIALKEARLLGKNRINVYRENSEYEAYQKEIHKHIPILFDALQHDLIVPYFQPIYNNQTQSIAKYEALARIVDNSHKIILPKYFIEAAELSGMLPEITRIMIDKSFQFFQGKSMEFSINIGEQDLNDSYLVDYLQKKAEQYNIFPHKVVIEILEGISVDVSDQNLNQLKELKEQGFQLAIDDFGAQHSNFERIHRLNVDYIKIDGSFIKNIDNDISSYKIAQTITHLGKNMEAKVIAEFVHSQAVYNKILELGIEFSQGYYFGEPKATERGVFL